MLKDSKILYNKEKQTLCFIAAIFVTFDTKDCPKKKEKKSVWHTCRHGDGVFMGHNDSAYNV